MKILTPKEMSKFLRPDENIGRNVIFVWNTEVRYQVHHLYMSGTKSLWGTGKVLGHIGPGRGDTERDFSKPRIRNYINICISVRQIFSGAFAKLRKATISFVRSFSVRPFVSPRGRTQLSTGRVLMELDTFELLSKICRENSSFIKNRH
jgi:hypothetical protein